MAKPKTNARGTIGRPPAHRAGEVDVRILDTAAVLFLAQGFEATSCEQVAAQAGCGKASIYARYADKSELFAATIKHQLASPSKIVSAKGAVGVCTEVLESMLTTEAVQLKRLLIAEATRFPERVAEADRVVRGRSIAAMAGELSGGDAEALVDIAFAPLELRALLGEKLAVVRAQVRPRVEEALALLRRR